jgi:hypothetical protein
MTMMSRIDCADTAVGLQLCSIRQRTIRQRPVPQRSKLQRSILQRENMRGARQVQRVEQSRVTQLDYLRAWIALYCVTTLSAG